MDWVALTAMGTTGAALAALMAAVVTRRVGNDQVKSAIMANGVNLAIQIRAHVNSSEFRGARYKAVKALLAGEYTSDVIYVLDELETIGLLIRKGVLDKEIIWTMISSLVINYVAAARPYVDEDRRRNPTLWTNLLCLNDQMIEVEQSHGGTDVDASATYRSYLETEVREMAPNRDAAAADAAGGDTHAGEV